MEFGAAFETLIGHEGGYVNDPTDPGGETKYGISKRAYPRVDIKGLTLEGAKRLYREDYWDPLGGDSLGDPLDYAIFDLAVNSGVKTATKMLQTALGILPDGAWGPASAAALTAARDRKTVALRVAATRLGYMTCLATWEHHSKGWARRIAAEIKRIAATP